MERQVGKMAVVYLNVSLKKFLGRKTMCCDVPVSEHVEM